MKNAVVAIQRMEGKYIREWVNHYQSLGFDKVIICDNNQPSDTEDIGDILKDYIEQEFVVIEDYRGRIKAQMRCYTEMYLKYGNTYNILYCDIDEFLTLKCHKNITELIESIPSDWEAIVANWMTYGDNGLIYADYSKGVQERFTEPRFGVKSQYWFDDDCHVKSIIRCGLKDVQFISNPHVSTTPLLTYNVNGKRCDNSPFQPIDWGVAYFKHYTTKSLQEYCENKLKRGTGDRDYETFLATYKNRYFKINDWTEEKEEYLLKMGYKGV